MSENIVNMFDDYSLQIDLKRDVSAGTSPKIIYKKPNGVVGEWVANISGTFVHYNILNGALDLDGYWLFEARVLLGGLKVSSRIVGQIVNKPLDV